MADKSKIEWTDATWQVSGGCDRVSEGCRNCYAERLVGTRQRHLDSRKNLTVVRGDGRPHWTGEINLYPENLDIPLRWAKPRRVFVDSLSDLFHKDVPFEFIDRLFGVMALCPMHTFQVLTKRPERMREYFETYASRHRWALGASTVTGVSHDNGAGGRCHRDVCNCEYPLPNVWLGTSVEDQETADKRVPDLLKCPAAVRFLSCEPLLGPVDLGRVAMKDKPDGVSYGTDALHGVLWACSDQGECGDDCPRIDWVIVGGESGPGARPFNTCWAHDLVRQCQSASVACFVKQLGSSPHFRERPLALKDRKGGDMEEWDADLRVREFPEVTHVR